MNNNEKIADALEELRVRAERWIKSDDAEPHEDGTHQSMVYCGTRVLEILHKIEQLREGTK
jgi:hypothetical protein